MNSNRFAALPMDNVEEPDDKPTQEIGAYTSFANRASRKVFIFLLGPSEALKITLCRRIQRQLCNVDVVSAEAILTQILREKSDIVREKYHLTESEHNEISQYGNHGEPIPANTMVKIMNEAIFPINNSARVRPVCLIEGFPRAVQQWREFKRYCRTHGLWPGRSRCFFIEIEPGTAALVPSQPGREIGKWKRERVWAEGKDDLLRAASDSANEVARPIRVDLTNDNVDSVARQVTRLLNENEHWRTFH